MSGSDGEKVPLADLPKSIREKLAGLDKNGDGVIDAAELAAHGTAGAPGAGIPLAMFAPEVRKKLEVFDQDGGGQVDPSELVQAADMYARSKKKAKVLTQAVVGLVVLLLVLLGAITGLVYAVVELSKDTSTSGSKMTVARGGAKDETVATANSKVALSLGEPGAEAGSMTADFASNIETLQVTFGGETHSLVVTSVSSSEVSVLDSVTEDGDAVTSTALRFSFSVARGGTVTLEPSGIFTLSDELIEALEGSDLAEITGERRRNFNRRRHLLGAADEFATKVDGNNPTLANPTHGAGYCVVNDPSGATTLDAIKDFFFSRSGTTTEQKVLDDCATKCTRSSKACVAYSIDTTASTWQCVLHLLTVDKSKLATAAKLDIVTQVDILGRAVAPSDIDGSTKRQCHLWKDASNIDLSNVANTGATVIASESTVSQTAACPTTTTVTALQSQVANLQNDLVQAQSALAQCPPPPPKVCASVTSLKDAADRQCTEVTGWLGPAVGDWPDNKVHLPLLEKAGVIFLSPAHDAETGKITEIHMPRLKEVSVAFKMDNLGALTAVNLGALESVGGYEAGTGADGFRCDGNPKLTSISLPKLVTIAGGLTISNNALLKTAECPLMETVGSLYVAGNSQMTTFAVPKLTTVLRSASAGGGHLGSPFTVNKNGLPYISIPKLVTAGGVVNIHDAEVDLPKITSVNGGSGTITFHGSGMCYTTAASKAARDVGCVVGNPVDGTECTGWYDLKKAADEKCGSVDGIYLAGDWSATGNVATANKLKKVKGHFLFPGNHGNAATNSIKELHLPALKHVGGTLALPSLANLEKFSAPELESVGANEPSWGNDGLTVSYSKLTKIELNKLKEVDGSFNFMFNTLLKEIDMPEVTRVGRFLLGGNTVLNTVSMPKLAMIERPASASGQHFPSSFDIWDHNDLKSLALPELVTVKSYMSVVNQCVQFPKLSSVSGGSAIVTLHGSGKCYGRGDVGCDTAGTCPS